MSAQIASHAADSAGSSVVTVTGDAADAAHTSDVCSCGRHRSTGVTSGLPSGAGKSKSFVSVVLGSASAAGKKRFIARKAQLDPAQLLQTTIPEARGSVQDARYTPEERCNVNSVHHNSFNSKSRETKRQKPCPVCTKKLDQPSFRFVGTSQNSAWRSQGVTRCGTT